MERKRPISESKTVEKAGGVVQTERDDNNLTKVIKDSNPPRLRWRKIGGGVHNHRDGQVVRQGEVLLATEHEIKSFKHLFVALDILPEPRQEEPTKRPVIVSAGKGKYNVINIETQEPINAVPLNKEDAEALISDE